MPIAGRIRKALEFAEIKPAELSRRSGVPQARLSQILSGKTPSPRWDTISKLAKALDVREQWLFAGEGEMRAPPDKGHGYVSEGEGLCDEQRELLKLWKIADEVSKETVLMILKAAAARSRKKDGGGSISTDMKSA